MTLRMPAWVLMLYLLCAICNCCVAFDERGLFRFALGTGEGRLVAVVLLDYIRKQSAGKLGVAFAGEVSMIGLRPADGDPLAHGAEASHARALIPVRAVHLPADPALSRDDAVDSGEWLPCTAAGAECAVGRPDDENGGLGSQTAAARDNALEHGCIAFFCPAAVAGLVGAVGKHDERGIRLKHQGLLECFVPAEEERCFGPV